MERQAGSFNFHILLLLEKRAHGHAEHSGTRGQFAVEALESDSYLNSIM